VVSTAIPCDRGEHEVDDRCRVVVRKRSVRDEAAVERWAGKQVDGNFQIGGWGDFASKTCCSEEVPERLAAALSELLVEA
jgi:hypothetical protein